MSKLKTYTVAVGCYSLDAEALRNHTYRTPKPLFAYDTNSAKQAARILAEMINGKTRRAKATKMAQPIGHGMKYVIMTADGDWSLRQFRERFLA